LNACVAGLLAVTGFTLWGFNWIMKRNNPASKEETAAQDRIRRFMRNYRFDGRKLPSLGMLKTDRDPMATLVV